MPRGHGERWHLASEVPTDTAHPNRPSIGLSYEETVAISALPTEQAVVAEVPMGATPVAQQEVGRTTG